MTTNTLPRFISDNMMSRCMGTNHTDTARRGFCGRCGHDVVKTDKGRILNVNMRYNANDRHVEDYACWSKDHTCDTIIAAKYQAAHDAKLAAGELVYGQNVVVARGRKLAKGTTGVIRFVDLYAEYGPRVGLSVEGCEGLQYTAMKNVDALVYVMPAAEEDHMIETLGEPEPQPEPAPSKPRAAGSHANCTHPATKSGRAACRRANAASV